MMLVDTDLDFDDAFRMLFGFHTGTSSAINPDVVLHIIRFIAIMSGTFLFSGMIIAVTTNTLRTYVYNRDSAKGKLRLSSHIIILRYSKEVPAVLTDLMFDQKRQTVLILSNAKKKQIIADLDAAVSALEEKPPHKLNLIVREGDPTSLRELQEVGVERAKGILVMCDQHTTGDELSETDFFGSLNLVLRLANFNLPKDMPIGVETSTQEAADIMRELRKEIVGLHDKEIQFFSHHKLLGQFMAISTVNADLCNVLKDMLDLSGSEFYNITNTTSIEDYLENYGAGIPTISVNGKLVCLGEDLRSVTKKRSAGFTTDRRLEPYKGTQTKTERKIFVIGENRKYKYFVEAIKSYAPHAVIKHYKTSDVDDFVTEIATQGDENTVVAILSDDAVNGKYDANVFLTLIELSRVTGVNKRQFKVFAEIIDPSNQKSLERFNVQSLVISTQVVSTFATKLLADAKAIDFYEGLLTNTADMEIWVTPANRVFEMQNAQTFATYAEFVNAGYYGSVGGVFKIMPLGIIENGQHKFFCNEMDKEKEFILNPTDKVVYARLKK